MKKRLLSLALAAALAWTLAVPALAAGKTVVETIPCGTYDHIWNDCDDGYGIVRVVVGGDERGKGGQVGFANREGQLLTPCQYEALRDDTGRFVNGLEPVYRNQNGKLWCGVIDTTGKEVIPCTLDNGSYVPYFDDGFAPVHTGDNKTGKYGFIDKTGKAVVPCKYGRAENFSQGFAAVAMDSGEKDERGNTIYKWGFIDKTGREVVPCKYHEVKNYSEGLAAVAVDSGKKESWGEAILTWGYVDETGKEVIPCGYALARGFCDGLAIVRKREEQRAYFVDKTGKVVIHDNFDDMDDFHNGFAMVKKDGKWGVIDTTGKLVLDYQYDDTRYERNGFHDGMAEVRRDGKVGLVSIVDSSRAAFASTQTVEVDGRKVEFQCYALKDAAGNDTNYIKLRDLADILNGSAAQFEVGWNGNVTITTERRYTKNGSEQNTPFSGNRLYQKATAQTLVNGKAADLAAFTLTDDTGGGYTYFKLRDLGEALGFKVDWSAEKGHLHRDEVTARRGVAPYEGQGPGRVWNPPLRGRGCGVRRADGDIGPYGCTARTWREA